MGTECARAPISLNASTVAASHSLVSSPDGIAGPPPCLLPGVFDRTPACPPVSRRLRQPRYPSARRSPASARRPAPGTSNVWVSVCYVAPTVRRCASLRHRNHPHQSTTKTSAKNKYTRMIVIKQKYHGYKDSLQVYD